LNYDGLSLFLYFFLYPFLLHPWYNLARPTPFIILCLIFPSFPVLAWTPPILLFDKNFLSFLLVRAGADDGLGIFLFPLLLFSEHMPCFFLFVALEKTIDLWVLSSLKRKKKKNKHYCVPYFSFFSVSLQELS